MQRTPHPPLTPHRTGTLEMGQFGTTGQEVVEAEASAGQLIVVNNPNNKKIESKERKFALRLMSVVLLLVGVSVGVLGVYLFVKGWTNFMLDTLDAATRNNNEGMDDEYEDDEDDDDDDGSGSGIGEMETMTDFDDSIRTRFIIRYSTLVAFQLLCSLLFLRKLMVWLYRKSQAALDVGENQSLGQVLHSVIWLVGGMILLLVLQALLLVQNVAQDVHENRNNNTLAIEDIFWGDGSGDDEDEDDADEEDDGDFEAFDDNALDVYTDDDDDDEDGSGMFFEQNSDEILYYAQRI